MTCSLHRRFRTRRLGVWGVAIVFVLQTLAWSGMPVFAADADKGWVAICTSEGIKRVFLGNSGVAPDGQPQNTPSPVLADHCDLCVFAQGLGMAPAPAQLSAADIPVLTLQAHSVEPDVPGSSYTPQLPRAPPVCQSI